MMAENMAIMPRAAACARGWFPPATFQLRLRSLKAIIFIASAKDRNGHVDGYFYVTLHEQADGPAMWKGQRIPWSPEREERIRWTDIDIDPKRGHLGLKSAVVKVWFTPDDVDDDGNAICEASWGVYFSGLWCLGTHPPARGRLPADSIVFYMCGSYFSSAAHIRSQTDTTIPRYLHIGTSPADAHAVPSYDTTLLTRLHRIQRALRQQQQNNERLAQDLRARGLDRSDASLLPDAEAERKPAPEACASGLPSLRRSAYEARRKRPLTRMREVELAARCESLRMRSALLRRERDQLEQRLADTRAEVAGLAREVQERTSVQMDRYHLLAKDKASLVEWQDQFCVDLESRDVWEAALRRRRLGTIAELDLIFPLGDLGGRRPTIRWVTLPPADEIRESCGGRNETSVSVAVGWLTHLLFVISRILDVPLRYPVNLMGSTSSIFDDVKRFDDRDRSEFPLFVKGTGAADWSRFEYGVYLLNKNISQLRWHCGLVTNDLKPILRNVRDLLDLSSRCRPLPADCSLHAERQLAPRNALADGLARKLSPAAAAEPGKNALVEEITDNNNDDDDGGEDAEGPVPREFWNDVTHRANALSNPSSFQRPRP